MSPLDIWLISHNLNFTALLRSIPPPKSVTDNQSSGCFCLIWQRWTMLTCHFSRRKRRRRNWKKKVAAHFSADLILANSSSSKTFSGPFVQASRETQSTHCCKLASKNAVDKFSTDSLSSFSNLAEQFNPIRADLSLCWSFKLRFNTNAHPWLCGASVWSGERRSCFGGLFLYLSWL